LRAINSIIGTQDYYRLNSGLNGTYLKFPVIVNTAYKTKVSDILGSSHSLGRNWIDVTDQSNNPLLAG
jgi:hypothetical protein